MKLSRLFKILIDVLFYVTVMTAVSYPIAAIFYNVSSTAKSLLETEGPYATLLNIAQFIFILFLAFILYQFRRFAIILKEKRLFSSEAILKIKNIGILFNSLGIAIFLLQVLIRIDKIHFTFSEIVIVIVPSFIGFGIPCFMVGVFLLLLSDAFKKALVLKEENDLTV